MINFGVGQPSEDLLPVDLVRTASADFLAVAHPLELNYGERQGDEGFRRSLAGLLTREYESDVTADSLFVTAGNSQALDFVCGEFAHWGDTVFVEEPSYFLAHQIFRDHGLNPIGIPVDSDGLVIEALHEALTRHRPTLVYTIPSFHNPGGQSLSVERRKELARLSLEHDFVVVADEDHGGPGQYPVVGVVLEDHGARAQAGVDPDFTALDGKTAQYRRHQQRRFVQSFHIPGSPARHRPRPAAIPSRAVARNLPPAG
jgi:aspartate/tyrosine/aromatic aminotransferase